MTLSGPDPGPAVDGGDSPSDPGLSGLRGGHSRVQLQPPARPHQPPGLLPPGLLQTQARQHRLLLHGTLRWDEGRSSGKTLPGRARPGQSPEYPLHTNSPDCRALRGRATGRQREGRQEHQQALQVGYGPCLTSLQCLIYQGSSLVHRGSTREEGEGWISELKPVSRIFEPTIVFI